MKRKNKETTINSDEEASDDEEMEENVVDNDEIEETGLDSSATDSDEGESVIDSDKRKRSKSEKVKDQIYQRYQERKGKQLYIRFPHKIPETQKALEEEVKELTPLVVKVHKPRQRHVRFCLIDFATEEDRDTALKKLKKSIKRGDLQKYVVSIPRTESTDFVQELTERKIKSLENKRAKRMLKKATKKSLKENNFTSTLVVFNLPKNTSTLQIRKLFENAVDINLKPGKGKFNKEKCVAAVTFPTTMDARNVIKKKLYLGDNELVVKFDNKKCMKKQKPGKALKNTELSHESEPITKKPKLEQSLHDAKSSGNDPKSTKSKKAVKNKLKVPKK